MEDSAHLKLAEEDDELLNYLLQPQDGDLLQELEADPNFMAIGDQISEVNTGMEGMFRNKEDGALHGDLGYDGMDDLFFGDVPDTKGSDRGTDVGMASPGMDMGLGLDMGLDMGLGSSGLGLQGMGFDGTSRFRTGSGSSTPSQMAMAMGGGQFPHVKPKASTSARATGAPKARQRTARKPKAGSTTKGMKAKQSSGSSKIKRESSTGSFGADSDDGGDGDGFDADGLPESEEKRQRRLARNRESARQSRRRKKKHLELLEEKVSVLTKEIDDLRRASLEASTLAHENRRQATLRKVEAMLNNKQVSQEELGAEVSKLLQRFGPNTAERRMVLDYHYNQIANLLLPPYTKFLLWTMNQGEDFFDAGAPGTTSKGNSGLWPLVSAELGLNDEQQEKLKQNYKSQDSNMTKEECNKLSRCLNCLEQMRRGLDTRAAAVQAQSEALSKILTPEQSSKYHLWMEQNKERIRACGLDHDNMLLSNFEALSVSGDNQQVPLSDPKFQYAQAVLQKPDSELSLSDLEALLAVVEG